MKLKKLLKDVPVQLFKGSKELEITGVCSNSKRVAPGNLFVARKGRSEDGANYIPEALASGAVAVLTDIFDPSLKNVAQLIDPDVELLEAEIAAHYYQHADKELFLAGITGTNGKTSTSCLLRHFLTAPKALCGLVGTIEYIIGTHRYLATRTTPDVATNHKMLREMVLQGCKSAVMEVTSHALDQGRVACIDFDVAIFTNLTLDHLDYHGTMEEYAAAKSRLFQSLDQKQAKAGVHAPKTAIVNSDSPWHQVMTKDCKARILTYGIDAPADLRATEIAFSVAGTSFILEYAGEKTPIKTTFVGKHNVYNVLAAIGAALTYGKSLEDLQELLKTAPGIPGRLQRVPNHAELNIFVDFAHTDDALSNVLATLAAFKQGRIITVFGCGGDRDRSKRPKMAAASNGYSDITIVTSDNPRSEDPEEIIREVVSGFPENAVFETYVDREEAIQRAIDLATPQDIVLIAGKGHEHVQVFSHKTIEFDDLKVAARLCEEYAYH